MNLVDHRRALHQIPELDFALTKTVAYVTAVLQQYRCRLSSPAAGSVCAFFDFGREATLAFRADMDALPISEQNDVPYASTHPGAMHACGHDGHTAMLLELARRIDAMECCSRNILLIFQPAEETVGGAKSICDSGILEETRVEALFGLHLWPGLAQGKIFSRPGPMMSQSCEVDVDIFGKSAHIGRSWEGRDALNCGMVFYAMAAAAERNWPGDDFRLLKFGHMESGTVRNAISDHTRLEGCLRTYRGDLFRELQEKLLEIGRDLEESEGCRVQVHFSEGCRAVWNPQDLHDRIQAIRPFEYLPEPSMTTEDFSHYQQRLPAMFFFLGIGDGITLHSGAFDFDDEAVLPKGPDFFEAIARGWGQ